MNSKPPLMELPKGERPKHPNEKQDVKCDVNCANNHAGQGELPSANFLRRLFILRQGNKSHRQSRNSGQRTKTPKAKDESDYARNHGCQRQTLARTCESRLIGRRRWRLPHRRGHRRAVVRGSEEETAEIPAQSFFSYSRFFFKDTRTTEIYSLPLPAALPICSDVGESADRAAAVAAATPAGSSAAVRQ